MCFLNSPARSEGLTVLRSFVRRDEMKFSVAVLMLVVAGFASEAKGQCAGGVCSIATGPVVRVVTTRPAVRVVTIAQSVRTRKPIRIRLRNRPLLSRAGKFVLIAQAMRTRKPIREAINNRPLLVNRPLLNRASRFLFRRRR